MIVFIGMETSGALRTRYQALGHYVISCDVLPAEDGSTFTIEAGGHIQGDVFEALEYLWSIGLWPDLAIFHPTCTYLTNAAEWAYKDPDFDRYPGVGYHQKLKPETLFGAQRRAAREEALNDVRRIIALPIERKVIENPKGAISESIRKPSQAIQPNWFGDDASKLTHLWYFGKDGEPLLDMRLRRTAQATGRIVDDGRPQLGLFGTGIERFSNQTDSGENALTPGPDRWKERSRTYPGVADAMADQWSKLL